MIRQRDPGNPSVYRKSSELYLYETSYIWTPQAVIRTTVAHSKSYMAV